MIRSSPSKLIRNNVDIAATPISLRRSMSGVAHVCNDSSKAKTSWSTVKPAKASYKLHQNDEIEVELTVPATASFAPENIPVDVVYEDDTLVVVNKPAGLIVHPAAGMRSGTLANALAYHFQELPLSTGVARAWARTPAGS